MADLVTLRAIQDALVEGLRPSRDVVEIGPFVTCFHPSDSLCWINQAVPVGEVTISDCRDLISAYKSRGRIAFLEFSTDLWPSAPAALEAAGLECILETPVMAMTRGQWTGAATEARSPMPGEFAELCRVTSAAFGMAEPSAGSDESLAKNLKLGSHLAALRIVNGEVVSGGQAFGTTAIREIAGLGTRDDSRRRGYCTDVLRSLTNQHFNSDGELCWLTPGDAAAERVYRSAGFFTIGRQVAYGIPPTE